MEIVYSSSNNTNTIPELSEDKKPKIGQQFDSIKDAFVFYNKYAHMAGFSARCGSSKRSKLTKSILRKEFCYSKEGFRTKINLNSDRIRKHGLTRVGCNAKLAIVRSISGIGFMVKQFIESHNHVLAIPRKVHFLRSHRTVSSAKRSLTQQLSAANVPTCQQFSLLELQAGGIENIGCLEQDLHNSIRDANKALLGHDANMLYEYFQTEKERNPSFTFSIVEDDEKRLKHCFWADANCRKSYKVFGDVVVFDTTYNTNRYSMIFAPFVGVNNHGQTTLLGCAFLSDETTNTFEWLLKVFLANMPAGPPRMIITDQDPAMGKAIAEVMPSTVHRFCIWHIMMKCSEKVGSIIWKEHSKKFNDCVYNSESPDEFEAAWADALEKSKLTSNGWLKTQYEIRARWIPAYFNDTFSAGMSSSQRAESAHSFFKRFVSKHNSLMDFVVRFNRAVKCTRQNELKLDHADIDKHPKLKTSWLMEKRMREIYTHSIFDEFQEEAIEVMAYQFIVVSENENMSVYHVKRVDGSSSRMRKIVEEKSSNFVSCSCKKFESHGIPCRHMLSYFSRLQIFELPDKYILRRWTKAAKFTRMLDDSSINNGDVCDASLLLRHNSLFRLASNVIDDAVITKEASDMVREKLESLHKRVKSMTQCTDATVSASNVTPSTYYL